MRHVPAPCGQLDRQQHGRTRALLGAGLADDVPRFGGAAVARIGATTARGMTGVLESTTRHAYSRTRPRAARPVPAQAPAAPAAAQRQLRREDAASRPTERSGSGAREDISSAPPTAQGVTRGTGAARWRHPAPGIDTALLPSQSNDLAPQTPAPNGTVRSDRHHPGPHPRNTRRIPAGSAQDRHLPSRPRSRSRSPVRPPRPLACPADVVSDHPRPAAPRAPLIHRDQLRLLLVARAT